MIIINNPSNPTGSTTPLSALRSLVALAAPRGIILLSDEVYRPLFHSLPGPPPPSLLSLGYSNSIATGSMSKSFSLAGLRLGWMASCSADLVERICGGRHFTTISVSQLDDQVASFALSPEVLPRLLSRNLALARRNLDMLSDFVDRFPQRLQWVRPTAGTTAFIRFLEPPAAADGGGDGRPVQDDTELCLSLLRDTSALVVPGRRCFGRDVDFEGYVRIGYVCATEVLENALDRLGRWLQTENPIGSTA